MSSADSASSFDVEHAAQILSTLLSVFNGLSVGIASLALIAHLVMKYMYPNEMKKLVLKLSFGILVCEVIYHVCSSLYDLSPDEELNKVIQSSNILAAQPYDFLTMPNTTQACAFVGGVIYVWSAMLSAFYCCAIVIYYHSIIVLQWKYKRSWDRVLLFSPIVVATVIVGITWAAGLFGWNGLVCYYRKDGLTPIRYFVIVFFTFYIW